MRTRMARAEVEQGAGHTAPDLDRVAAGIRILRRIGLGVPCFLNALQRLPNNEPLIREML